MSIQMIKDLTRPTRRAIRNNPATLIWTKLSRRLGPARDKNSEEILRMRDLVLGRLAREPYPSGYCVSTRWQDLVDELLTRAARTNDVRRIASLGLVFFDVGLPVADVDHLLKSRANYVSKHPELALIEESDLAPQNSVTDCGGARFSHSLEQAFSYYDGLVAGIGAAPLHHVVEIGSGYGRFIRVLRLAGRARHFTLVDLPQSLLIAFAFLRLHFPDASMRVIESRDDIYPGMERDFEFLFCPVQFIAALRPTTIDLIVITYSLGEMQQGCIDYLMQSISAMRPGYFYSLNSAFTDKKLHFDLGHLAEGSEIVLKLQPMWWPRTFGLHQSLDDGISRTTVESASTRRWTGW